MGRKPGLEGSSKLPTSGEIACRRCYAAHFLAYSRYREIEANWAKMPFTRDFKEIIRAMVERDPSFSQNCFVKPRSVCVLVM